MDLIDVNIDGVSYKVQSGLNIIEAMKSVGKNLPHFCYHPKLSIAGNCRLCLVEMGTPMRDRATGEAVLDENGFQKIGWMPKPVIGCATKVSQGMHIKANTENLKKTRESIIEFLLINHPLDCPICDKAGECALQEYSNACGSGQTKFKEEKNVKPKLIEISDKILLDDERCILCSRCIRFSKEILKKQYLTFTKRGSKTELRPYPNTPFDSNYSLNVTDLCPVGALTSTDFRFKMRLWFLKQTKSICTESSTGVNTVVWSRQDKIYRITPRRNDNVNSCWMSDSGRDMFKQYEQNRINTLIDGQASSTSYAINRLSDIINDKEVKLDILASASLSIEELFLVKMLANKLSCKVHFAPKIQKGDDFLISKDAHTNMRGAFALGLTNEYPSNLSELEEKVSNKQTNTLLVLDEDLLKANFNPDLLKKLNILYFGTKAASFETKIQIPSASVFEKQGSFINNRFILQAFDKAINPPQNTLSGFEFLSIILEKSGVKTSENIDKLRKFISSEIPYLKDITNIPSTGIKLENKFSNISFIDEPKEEVVK